MKHPSIGTVEHVAHFWTDTLYLEASVLIGHRQAAEMLLNRFSGTGLCTLGFSYPTCIARHLDSNIKEFREMKMQPSLERALRHKEILKAQSKITENRRITMPGKVQIHGRCDKKFAKVKEAFAANFEDGSEIGASFAATINGEFVVDIWGGYADAAQTRAWERDTIVNVWSTTKVMTALCAHILVDRGQLDLNAPVAKYWPEFAQAGKERMPVKYLLSHTSGLSGWEEPITIEALYDWDRAVGLLAKQAPWWEPGTKSGYHSLTFGYTLGELVRRIAGKSLGTFFREEVATPLNADFHIGLPAKFDSRVAELIFPPVLKPGDPAYLDPQFTAANFPLSIKTFANPPPFTPEVTRSRAWRAAEIPAANGHGNARSVARVASVLACGGTVDGIKLLSLPTIEKSIEEQCYGTDLALTLPIRWGLGWGLPSKELPVSPNPRSFFWGGWGGSSVVMDLDAKLSLAYVMNKMGVGLVGDSRSAKLATALYDAVSHM